MSETQSTSVVQRATPFSSSYSSVQQNRSLHQQNASVSPWQSNTSANNNSSSGTQSRLQTEQQQRFLASNHGHSGYASHHQPTTGLSLGTDIDAVDDNEVAAMSPVAAQFPLESGDSVDVDAEPDPEAESPADGHWFRARDLHAASNPLSSTGSSGVALSEDIRPVPRSQASDVDEINKKLKDAQLALSPTDQKDKVCRLVQLQFSPLMCILSAN